MRKKDISIAVIICSLSFAMGVARHDNNHIPVVKAGVTGRCIYTYDNLGRIDTAEYPDGTIVRYTYDSNGNILSVLVEKNPLEESSDNKDNEDGGKGASTEGNGGEGRKDGGKGASTEGNGGEGRKDDGKGASTENHDGGSNVDGDKETTENVGSGGKKIPEGISIAEEDVRIHNTNNLKLYNEFKRMHPVIKNLKLYKKNGKKYLKIGIKGSTDKERYQELGYQVKYAYNSKFKKPKSITVKRKLNEMVTTKKWKVSGGKNYYVKVRAYICIKSGKKIYSRYSKVKKIKQ